LPHLSTHPYLFDVPTLLVPASCTHRPPHSFPTRRSSDLDLPQRADPLVSRVPPPDLRIELVLRRGAARLHHPCLKLSRPRPPVPHLAELRIENDHDGDGARSAAEVAVHHRRMLVAPQDSHLEATRLLAQLRHVGDRVRRVAAPVLGEDQQPEG